MKKNSSNDTNSARNFRKAGDHKAAERAARDAIRRNPDDHLAHVELALAMMKTSRVAEAMQEMLEAIRIQPADPRPYLALGKMYQIAGKTGLTIGLYKKGLTHNPRGYKLWEELVRAYQFDGDFRNAYKYAVLLAAKHNQSRDWIRAGNCAVGLGLFEKAEKAFQKSIAARAANWEAHYNLGELYFSAKLYKKAREHYVLAGDLNQKHFKPFNGIGLIKLIVDRDPAEAGKFFLRAIKLAPRRKELWLNMAIASAGRKSYEEAEKFAETTLKFAKPGDGVHEQASHLLQQFQNLKH